MTSSCSGRGYTKAHRPAQDCVLIEEIDLRIDNGYEILGLKFVDT